MMSKNFAKNKLKNNLFEYATSELSQDAFICWLASYAHEDAEKDSVLNECAVKMLEKFVPELQGKAFKLLNVERQVDKIDVLLTVECEGKIYKIIVEDKTYTSEHDSQLEKYKENLEGKHEESNVIVKGVYYKTGFQSNFEAVKEAGYKIIKREELLALLRDYADKTDNQIFISYYNYWNSKQMLADSYKTLPVPEWGWWAVYGFYDFMHTEFLDDLGFNSEYSYVANKSGGFECLYMPLKDASAEEFIVKGNRCWLYLQIESILRNEATSVEIRLKVANDNNKGTMVKICDLRDFLNKYVYKHTKFVKPAKLRAGKWMTVGIYDVRFDGNYKLNDFEESLKNAIDDYKRILANYNADNINVRKE